MVRQRYVGWLRVGTGPWIPSVLCGCEWAAWQCAECLFVDYDDADDVERIVLPEGVRPDGNEDGDPGEAGR